MSIPLGILDFGAVGNQPVAGYEVWWDASDDASFTFSSGSTVSTWTDRSANAYVLGAWTGTTNRNGTVNGLSTVLFTGASALQSNLAASAWAWLSDGTEYTIFQVIKPQSSGFGTILATGRSATNVVMFETTVNVISNDHYSGVYRGVSGSSAAEYLETSGHGDNTTLFTLYSDASNAVAADRMYTFKNNSTSLSGSVGGAGSPSASNPQATLAMGADGTGGAIYRYSGHICEIIIYKNQLLSQSERLANFTYLQEKWGI